MAAQSMAVVGLADGGFALLAEAPVSGKAASAEDLLAEDCS
jgi:CDP-diacylglycerol pyrophosphatase